ncbi:hypothetical protein JO84_gp154 [Aureococcus anophagefferens virus]|uniref:Uncharacterized protein n=1 Tax=Aureococcus anophagefferens virus TaxID=1474867 RepID=A0A076FG60_9VIRU|nr:hypothetical protein JO84_gp154 [Aureococcus anophagefferens virus]AII17259.1 hypothetical protein AaV_321 [Aureococcus anophagefferens virus]UOG94235.1 hypothetical protein MKD35_194 [Aureococcus anophagefferens virus]
MDSKKKKKLKEVIAFPYICNLEKRVIVKKVLKIDLDTFETLYEWQVANNKLPKTQKIICLKLKNGVPLTLREIQYENKRKSIDLKND